MSKYIDLTKILTKLPDYVFDYIQVAYDGESINTQIGYSIDIKTFLDYLIKFKFGKIVFVCFYKNPWTDDAFFYKWNCSVKLGHKACEDVVCGSGLYLYHCTLAILVVHTYKIRLLVVIVRTVYINDIQPSFQQFQCHGCFAYQS